MNQPQCLHHTGFEERILSREKDDEKQWEVIEIMRNDLKTLLLRIGIVIGSLQTISTIVIAIMVHYATK